MPDMYTNLYTLEVNYDLQKSIKDNSIHIHLAMGSELDSIVHFVEKNFSRTWANEAMIAICQNPVTCFVAVKDGKLLGFSCYDAGRRGMFGPIGVLPELRGQNIGKALLQETLLAMKYNGYGYAIIGYVGPQKFYEKNCNAVLIPGENPPPMYSNLAKDDAEGEKSP